jgi:hypothetical protein
MNETSQRASREMVRNCFQQSGRRLVGRIGRQRHQLVEFPVQPFRYRVEVAHDPVAARRAFGDVGFRHAVAYRVVGRENLGNGADRLHRLGQIHSAGEFLRFG